MNTQFYNEHEVIMAPPDIQEFRIGCLKRIPDDLELASPSLLAMQEIDSLREELRCEKQKRMIAQAEVERMKFEKAAPNTFLGFPIRDYDTSEDGRMMKTWEIKIEGMWYEILTCALRFDREEAIKAICEILKSKV